MLVPRTVTIDSDKESSADTNGTKRHAPMESLRIRHAYVLLGDPGMGKSSAFEVEAAAAGTKPVKAHDFIALEQRAETWAGKPIFIDGLDETRAGSKGGRTSLDAIRSKLDNLGRPSFRLSCRAADWLGESDKEAIQRLVPTGEKLEVVHLDQLTHHDVEKILSKNFNIANPLEFIGEAEKNRISELLFNPQTLRLLAEAVGNDGHWPASKRETYEMACEKLAAEPNIEHKAEQRANPTNLQDLLDAAGYLCTVNLISDVQRFSPITGDDPSTLGMDAIKNPNDLPLPMVLRTRLFHSLGDDQFSPVHRSIAEFLAARFVEKRITYSLPPGRIRALISGADGEVVTELRAFAAWLGVFSDEFRKSQIEFDPLGMLIYGDAKGFHSEDKKLILNSIKRLGDSVGSINWSDWHAQTSDALGTPDMADEFERILRTAPTTKGDQLVADCVVEAIHRGEAFPNLGPVLLSVARDSRWWGGIRKIALRTVLVKQLADGAAARAFLDDVHSGAIKDDDDELLGVLLENLYPKMI